MLGPAVSITMSTTNPLPATKKSAFPLFAASLFALGAVAALPGASADVPDPISYPVWIPIGSVGATVPAVYTFQCTDPACTTGATIPAIVIPAIHQCVLSTCVNRDAELIRPSQDIDPLCDTVFRLCAPPEQVTPGASVNVDFAPLTASPEAGTFLRDPVFIPGGISNCAPENNPEDDPTCRGVYAVYFFNVEFWTNVTGPVPIARHDGIACDGGCISELPPPDEEL